MWGGSSKFEVRGFKRESRDSCLQDACPHAEGFHVEDPNFGMPIPSLLTLATWEVDSAREVEKGAGTAGVGGGRRFHSMERGAVETDGQARVEPLEGRGAATEGIGREGG